MTTLDLNSLCPGGTGKKIKHCECRDIIGELEKISRALGGDQRVAALDRINRALATKANRPCLLAMKAGAQAAMGEMQALEETVATFLQMAPDNLVALAHAAILETQKDHVRVAVERLQQGLAKIEDQMPGELYQAIGIVANGLMEKGKFMAARGHVLLQALTSRDQQAVEALIQISGIEQIPSLMKQDFSFDVAPSDAPWRQRFDTAQRRALVGAWQHACEEFDAIDKQFPGQPAILKNIAVAQTFLGNTRAAEAWHNYAALDGIEHQDAVLAEALAQMLDAEQSSVAVDIVTLVFPIPDANELLEQMSSMKSLVPQNVNSAQYAATDTPLPKGVFLLLDGPLAVADAELGLDDVREALGNLSVFGKETDRDARLEFTVLKNPQYERAMGVLSELLGDLVAEPASTEVVESVPNRDALWMARPFLSSDVPVAQSQALRAEFLQKTFEERWTALELEELGNITAVQAVQDPSCRVRLEAAILCLDQFVEVRGMLLDLSSLRTRLGLAEPPSIDLAETDLAQVRVPYMHRVPAEGLSDEQLLELFQRASMFGLRYAFRQFGEEIVKRDGLEEQVDRAAVYGRLAELSVDSETAITLVHKARDVAVAAKKSPATWLLQELAMRIMRQEPDEAMRLMNQIQSQHLKEPGVAEALYKMLQDFGLVSPTGATGPPQELPQEAAASAPSQAVWTPEGGEASSPDEKKESKLWLPGSD